MPHTGHSPELAGALRAEKERPFTLKAAAIRLPRRRGRGSKAGPIEEPDAKVAVFAAWLDERDNPAKVTFVAELRTFADTGKRKQLNWRGSPIVSSRA
jgi:hypothetical protein